jgi:hypothetical protein
VGFHEYDKGPEPVPVPFKTALDVEQIPIVASFPALAVGNGFTVTVTESVAVQPYKSETVRVYTVVEVGCAVGLEIVELFNPDDGDHEYPSGALPVPLPFS